ncbi:MAG: TonB-dependent receptor plug domain-containing protein [Candidatus Korobacteraceae bacterium]
MTHASIRKRIYTLENALATIWSAVNTIRMVLQQRAPSRTVFATATLFYFLGSPATVAAMPGGSPRAQSESLDGSALRDMSLADLGGIEVTTASKEPEQVWHTAAAIHVITQDDIRRSGATTIAEALRLAPGVQIARMDSNHWAIGIRGFANGFSKSVLVLIDGRSVYTPLFAGVFWGLQDTLLEDIDRIEVIRGPGATIWGSNAVNGVINIITKNSQQSHGSIVSVTGGTIEQGLLSFRYGSGNNRTLDYRLYGKTSSRGGQFHPQGANFDTWRMGQVGARMDWSHGDRDTISLQGDSYRTGQGQRVGVGSLSPPAQLIVDGAADVFGGNIIGKWRHRWTSAGDTQIQAYYDHTDILVPHFGEIRNTVDIDVVHHLSRGRHNLAGGGGIRWSPARFIQTVPTLNFTPHRQTNRIFSGFLQEEAAIVHNRLYLTFGSKLENNNYSGLQFQPSIRLLWRPTLESTLWASVTRALRAPSRIERDVQLTGFVAPAPPLPIFIQVEGNPDLRPERLVGYEVGYRTLLHPQLYVDVSVFHNQYSDLISFGDPSISIDEQPPPTRITLHVPWANGIRGATDGIEVSPVWNPRSWWQLKGYYAYLRFGLSNKPNNGDTGTVTSLEGSSPKHQTLVMSALKLPWGFQIDQTYRYVSSLPAQRVPSYHTADVRLGWRFAKEFELSVVGQNLLQPRHAEFAHDPGPTVGIQRSGYIKLNWSRE